MNDPIAWSATVLFGVLFVLGAGANAYLLFFARRRTGEGEHTPSLVALVPGLLGMAACLLSPSPWLKQLAWLPLLLDVGCLPYLALALIALAGEKWRRWRRGADAAPQETGIPVPRRLTAVQGCLIGTAAGDALGLPMEGLSKRRQQRMFRVVKPYSFVWGRGMCSDDTEHTVMVAQALIASGGDPGRFGKSLAWRLRFWFLGLPAGIGWATLRAILKLWVGFPAEKSGVFSAGNGPAMRSAILGVCCGDSLDRLSELVRITTRITHTDPRAEAGALAVALAANYAVGNGVRVSPQAYVERLSAALGREHEMVTLASRVAGSVEAREDTEHFAEAVGCVNGVSGFVYHTVPVALHAWLSHPGDFTRALVSAIRCGGDTDTVAAIVGGIAGAAIGGPAIPAEFRTRLLERPRTLKWLEEVGKRLFHVTEQQVPGPAVPLRVSALLFRNLVFLLLVLLHGFRRLLPPY